MKVSSKIITTILLLCINQLAISQTVLPSGQSVSSHVSQSNWEFFKFTPAPGVTSVSIALSGLDKDLDLYVKKGSQVSTSSYDCRPYKVGNRTETCSIALSASKPTTIFIGVYGYRSSNFVIKGTSIGGNNNVQTLVSGQAKTGSVSQGDWKYYKISSASNATNVTVKLSGLNKDLDLYVKKGSQVSKSNYSCRPYHSGTKAETCEVTLNASETTYIGIYGFSSGNFQIKATMKKATPKKAVLLLHGLSDDKSIWNDLVSDSNGFGGRCTVLKSNTTVYESANSDGVFCFRIDFGSRDRTSNLRGLDNLTCNDHGGCSGDFSSYSQLGLDVKDAVTKMKQLLGSDVKIILLAHSRGGLAARAFLQSQSGTENVVALITTGTPHLGTPIARVYAYMKNNCIPRSSHESGACRDDWKAADQIYYDGKGIDMRVPSVSFLADNSTELALLNSKGNQLASSIKYVQLVYKDKKLGTMLEILGSPYNPFPSIKSILGWFLDDFSKTFERYVLGSNPIAKVKSLHGDGIVPLNNQHLSSVQTFNRNIRTYTKSGVLHTKQASRITDLHRALTDLYGQLGW